MSSRPANSISSEATVALVVRAQRGDADAFASLAAAFLRAAYSVALAIVGRPADAEDVAQDAFVLALERIRTCRQPERFAGWLLQIVRHQALSWLQKRRLRDVSADEGGATVAIAPVATEHAGLAERLVAALGGLTTGQREVVLLHDLEDWTHAEIATALGISEVMSRQHLFNARRLLRAHLAGDAVTETGS